MWKQNNEPLLEQQNIKGKVCLPLRSPCSHLLVLICVMNSFYDEKPRLQDAAARARPPGRPGRTGLKLDWTSGHVCLSSIQCKNRCGLSCRVCVWRQWHLLGFSKLFEALEHVFEVKTIVCEFCTCYFHLRCKWHQCVVFSFDLLFACFISHKTIKRQNCFWGCETAAMIHYFPFAKQFLRQIIKKLKCFWQIQKCKRRAVCFHILSGQLSVPFFLDLLNVQAKTAGWPSPCHVANLC